MPAKREITRADIMPMDDYVAIRKSHRRALAGRKQHRRIEIGPSATLYFENYDTMWSQIHEMLYIERGGEEQIADELRAYNPLIPKGNELVATLMFEIDDPVRRDLLLGRLGGVEHSVSIDVDGETVRAVAEDDVARSDDTGRASSVHFLHFPFTPAQIDRFRAPETRVTIAINHENYGHMAVMPEPVRQALGGDFD